MYRLKQLKLKNFLSHRSTEIEFSDGQKVLIDGVSGSGKSSICEAIIWALYGKGRSDNRSLIHRKEGSASVVLTLTGDREYRIERSVTRTGKHSVSVAEVTDDGMVPVATSGVKETQAFIERDIVRSSYLLFINSIAYPQDNTDSFVRQNAAKRKELLLEIVNANVLEEYEDKAKAKLKELEAESVSDRASIAMLESRVAEDKELAESHDGTEKELKRVEKEMMPLADKLSGVRTVRERMAVLVASEPEIKRSIDELEFAVKRARTQLKGKKIQLDELDTDGLKERLNGWNELKEEVEAAERWNDSYQKLLADQPVAHDHASDIDDLNGQLIELMSREVEQCPETHKPCPIITKELEGRQRELEQRLHEKKEKQNAYSTELEGYTSKVDALGPRPTVSLPEARKSLKEYEETYNTLSSVDKQRAALSETMANLRKEEKEAVDKLNETKKKKESLDGELDKIMLFLKESNQTEREYFALVEQQKSLSNACVLTKAAKDRYTTNTEALDKLKDKVYNVDKDIEDVSLLREALKPNGIQALVVDYVLPKLEDRINEILGQLSDFRVHLDTQRPGLSKGTLLEGLFISIFNEQGEEFDFEGYSGGERLKIVVAISEALAELQKADFRILDELFIGLDENSIEKFSEIMMTLNDRFSQLICISHLKSIKDIFPEIVSVVKTNGVSRVAS